MERHYNAFISYRHHPDDIRVAEDIHRSLERFHVPKAIRNQGKDIQRLFRDKDELPITSCLTQTITDALKSSDYLIVICSPHTKESVWVQREIETFLQTHDRSKILTVLAGGEPFEVIPEILLYEDTVDPATGKTVRKEIEPLSCDWRIDRKKALREELPRLAAALLDCAYDELRQRQRQYRMRRMIALFSAALTVSLGFTAYFIYNSIQIRKANEELQAANAQISAANAQIQNANIQIRQNLENALRNQSEYLASSAQERMEAGDRLTAIALALAALPGEEGDRPYVPAAEHALSDALTSYIAQENILSAGIFRAGAMVEDFKLSKDGKTIYILDARSIITVWDTFTFEKLGTIDLSGVAVSEMIPTAEGNLMISLYSYGTNLLCYSREGTLLWEMDYALDLVMQEDGSRIAVLQYVDFVTDQILFLDPETGDPYRESILLPDEDSSLNISGFAQQTYDPDKPLILRGVTLEAQYLYLLDIQTGKLRQLTGVQDGAQTTASILSVSYNQDANVLVLIDDDQASMNGTVGQITTYSPDGGILCCYDTKNGRLLWQTEIITYTYNSLEVLEQIPDSNHILCMMGNTFQILDGTTGEQIATCMVPNKPIEVIVDADQAWGMQENGQYFSYDYATNSCSTQPIVDEEIDIAVINQGVYTLSSLASGVTVYRSTCDHNSVAFQGAQITYLLASITYDNLLAVSTYDGIFMTDMEKNEILWEKPDYTGYNYKFLGFSTDGTQLWLWNSFEEALTRLNTQTGEAELVLLPTETEVAYTYFETPVFYAEDNVYFILETNDFLGMYQFDTLTGEYTRWLLPEQAAQADYSKTSVILGACAEYIWFWRNTGEVYEFSKADGTLRTLMSGAETQPRFLNAGDRIVFAAGAEVLCMAPGGEVLLQLTLAEAKAVSMHFFREELLILCDDGDIYRYDRSGTFLSKVEQQLYNTFYNSASAASWDDPLAVSWYETEDGGLLVNTFKAGNIIDTEHWECRGFIPYFVTYYQDTVINRLNNMLYAYPLYSTQDQILRAQEILDGYELSDEQKAFYGLD